jgi:centromeric protein E
MSDISLLTLGSVIATLAENAAKGRSYETQLSRCISHLLILFLSSSHVPFRNSKLTRLLQPSLSGNARISVICTINPEPSAVAETLSTLGFAKRVRGVKVRIDMFVRMTICLTRPFVAKRTEERDCRYRGFTATV